MEQTLGLGSHSHQSDGGGPSVLSEDGHLVRVSAKLLNVVLDPLEHRDLVQEPLVTSSSVVLSGQPSQRSQSVVEGDQDDILLQQVAWSKEEACSTTHDEGSTMEVDHDGSLLAVQLGGVDIEVETVLVSHGS